MSETEQEYADLLAKMWQLNKAPVGSPEHDLNYVLSQKVQQFLDAVNANCK